MINIKLTTPFPKWPLLRQTPGKKGLWGNCRFFVNDPTKDCDYWIVCEGLLEKEEANCLPQNTIFVTWEPPSVKTYGKKFVNQFHAVITCHQKMPHPHKIFQQQGLPWMVGGNFIKGTKSHNKNFSKNYDELNQISSLPKEKNLSVILSSKKFTPDHLRRYNFVMELKKYFKDKIDVFGRGINEINDKWDGLAPYKYHLTLENFNYPHFWTEKLADAYLANTLPFYWGCPNIGNYFAEGSFLTIDIKDTKRSIEIIEKAIAENLYEKNSSLIEQNKRLILNKYNLFALLAEYCQTDLDKADQIKNKQTIKLYPEQKNTLLKKSKIYLKNFFKY